MGHNALGAGKIISQGASLVDIALETKGIFNDKGWCGLARRRYCSPRHGMVLRQASSPALPPWSWDLL